MILLILSKEILYVLLKLVAVDVKSVLLFFNGFTDSLFTVRVTYCLVAGCINFRQNLVVNYCKLLYYCNLINGL